MNKSKKFPPEVRERAAFDCPRVAVHHNRAYLGKENSFEKHKDVAGDTRQVSRSAAGSDWADHKADFTG